MRSLFCWLGGFWCYLKRGPQRHPAADIPVRAGFGEAEGKNLPVLSPRHPRAWRLQQQEAHRWQEETVAQSWLQPQNSSHYLVLGARWLKAPRGDVEVLSSVGWRGGPSQSASTSPSHKIIHWASLSAQADDGSSGCGSCVYHSAARFDAYHPEG